MPPVIVAGGFKLFSRVDVRDMHLNAAHFARPTSENRAMADHESRGDEPLSNRLLVSRRRRCRATSWPLSGAAASLGQSE